MHEKGSIFNLIKDFLRIKNKQKKKKEKLEKIKQNKKYNCFYITILMIIGFIIGIFESKRKQELRIQKLDTKVNKIKINLINKDKEKLKTIPKQTEKLKIELIKIRPKNKYNFKELKKEVKTIDEEFKTILCDEKIVNNKKFLNKSSIINNKEVDNSNIKLENKLPLMRINKKIKCKSLIIGGLGVNTGFRLIRKVEKNLRFKESSKVIPNSKKKEKFSPTTNKLVIKKVNNEGFVKKEFVINNDKDTILNNDWYINKKEIEKALNLMLKDLNNEKQKIDSFKITLNNINISNFKLRKKTILNRTINLFRGIINFALDLLPLKLFKNKFLGCLTSSIILNNRLRYVKKTINNDYKRYALINFKKIIDSINSKEECLQKTREINNNSLEELKQILKSLSKYNDPSLKKEIDIILNNINDTRKIIIIKNKKIEEELKKLNEIKSNQKTKIKKLEN